MPKSINKTILIFSASLIITLGATFLIFNNSKKRKLIRIAIDEWKGWGGKTIDSNGKKISDGGLEYQSGYSNRVADYWKELGYSYTGNDTDVAWSSAFISFIMKQAGVGDDFVYSASHSDYITSFIENRKQNKKDAKFIAYKMNEVPIEEGDLVCYTRQDGITYDTKGNYKSHCDLVVKKDKRSIEVIGGNVGDSVTKKILPLDAFGNMADRTRNWFVTIKNNL